MYRINIEMYGIPQNISQESKITIEIEAKATLKDVVAALRRKIPALEGPVIMQGHNRLTENYTFIINGQFQPGDTDLSIQPDDRIVLVLLATGG